MSHTAYMHMYNLYHKALMRNERVKQVYQMLLENAEVYVGKSACWMVVKLRLLDLIRMVIGDSFTLMMKRKRFIVGYFTIKIYGRCCR